MAPVLAAAIVAAAALSAALWMIWPERPTEAMRRSFAGRKYAHRGLFDNSGAAPENSMAAFAAAAHAGYGIELDLRLSADGSVVVFHDPDLGRMCGVQGAVASVPLDRLAATRLLGSEERIPRLEEVLGAVAGAVPLLVEFKTGLPGGPGASALCEKAMEALDGYRGEYAVESFDYAVLEWFKERRPGVMRGQLAMGLRCYGPAMGARAAAALPAHRKAMLSWLLYNYRGRPHFISYRFQDEGLGVALCRLLGAMTAAWTVRTQAEARTLRGRWDAIIFEGFEA